MGGDKKEKTKSLLLSIYLLLSCYPQQLHVNMFFIMEALAISGMVLRKYLNENECMMAFDSILFKSI